VSTSSRKSSRRILNQALTTLILAEMAGLAGYQKLTDMNRLTIFAALIIVVLAISLAFFVVDSVLARRAYAKVAADFATYLADAQDIASNEQANGVDRISDIRTAERALRQVFDEHARFPQIFEHLGLFLFGVATLAAGAFLLGSELWKQLAIILGF